MGQMQDTTLRILICTLMIALAAFAFSGCDSWGGCNGEDDETQSNETQPQERTTFVDITTQRNMTATVGLSLDADSTCQDSGKVANAPSNGAVSGTAPSLIYTPDANFTGTDRFSWVIQCADVQTTFDVQVTVTADPVQTPTPTPTPVTTPTPNPTSTPTPTPIAQTEGDWLHTSGNRIVDHNGNTVWLTGANWFGFNASERVFHGLWSAHFETMIQAITQRGINILRIPISTQLLAEWKSGQPPAPIGLNYYANPELEGMNTLELFDYGLELCKKYGLKVLLDVHSAEANNSGHVFNMWYTDAIDTDTFYETWEWVAERYKDNDTLIAFDIENEPHGKPNERPRAKWDDSTDEDNWKFACEEASNRILNINPEVLVLCEGIEIYPMEGIDWSTTNEKQFYGTWWGGNLRGVADYPIDLGSHQDQLVYSPHDYGPWVYLQSWFQGDFTMQSLYDDVWYPNWFFIQEQNIAPLLIGEWGGIMEAAGPLNEEMRKRLEDNIKWLNLLRDFIIENHIHHTFWCLNPNSGDTGGLIKNNEWKTWDETKYTLLKPALWQDQHGKFVGLDHDVPLGGAGSTTGVSLNQFYQNGGTPPDPPLYP